MEIARPPQGRRWHDTARHSVASRPARHSIICATLSFTYSSMKETKQGTSFSVFVFLWLQSLWMDRSQSWEKVETMKDKRATGRTRACGRAGCPHATAGSASWALRHVTTATLCCFGNFMNKEGRSRTAGEEIAGEYCSPDTWRPTSWGDGGGRLAGLGGGRENEMMKGEGESRSGAMVAGQLGGGGARDGRAPSSSSLLLLNFIFTACEKFHKAQFHFPFPPYPGISFCGGPASSPPPLQLLCPYNVFLLSLEKQRKRHDGGPNKLFVRRNLLRKKSVWRMTLQRRRKMSVRRIIFWIRRKRHFTAASTRSENIFTFFEYTTNSYI